MQAAQDGISTSSLDLSLGTDLLLSDADLDACPLTLPAPDIDARFIAMQAMTTNAAFWAIGTMLELKCNQDTGFNIGVDISTLPSSLQPTIRQLTVPHKPYIDMLPWAPLRDRVLDSACIINETDFVNDMLSEKIKIWGSTPWDPMSWEFDVEMLRKWWFLMDEDTLRTTNFWRGQRGEQALVLPIVTVES